MFFFLILGYFFRTYRSDPILATWSGNQSAGVASTIDLNLVQVNYHQRLPLSCSSSQLHTTRGAQPLESSRPKTVPLLRYKTWGHPGRESGTPMGGPPHSTEETLIQKNKVTGGAGKALLPRMMDHPRAVAPLLSFCQPLFASYDANGSTATSYPQQCASLILAQES